MTEERFSRKQAEALCQLMESDSVAEAARNAGVGRSTIYEWLKDPDFAAELEERRRAEDRSRLNALRALIPKAMVVLSGLMESTDQRIRLRAASEVLRAYQGLVLADPTSPGRARHLTEAQDGLDTSDLPGLARAGVKRLLNGSMEPRSAQMLPAYLRLIDQLESPKGARGPSGRPSGKDSGRGRRGAPWWDDGRPSDTYLDDEMDEDEKEFMMDIISRVLEMDTSGNPMLAGWQEKVRELLSDENATMEELDRGIKEAQREYSEKHFEACLGRDKAQDGA